MNNATRLLQRQRTAEQDFTARELRAKREPKGWPASLLMFHLTQWRERMTNGLADFQAGRPYTPPPANIDEFNDAELPKGEGKTLDEMGRRADDLMGRLIDLSESVGDQPFKWNITNTSGEAIIRNSYLHPRVHLAAYYRENGEQALAWKVIEDTAADLRAENAPAVVLGAALCNLGGLRAEQGRNDEAIELLREGLAMRPDLKNLIAADPDIAPLRSDPRFAELVAS